MKVEVEVLYITFYILVASIWRSSWTSFLQSIRIIIRKTALSDSGTISFLALVTFQTQTWFSNANVWFHGKFQFYLVNYLQDCPKRQIKNKVKMNFIIMISDGAVCKVGILLNVCNSRSFSFFESYRRKFMLT